MQGYLEVLTATENRHMFNRKCVYFKVPVEILNTRYRVADCRIFVLEEILIQHTDTKGETINIWVASNCVSDTKNVKLKDSDLFWKWFHRRNET